MNQVFCLGAVVTIKVRKNGPSIKMFHENDWLAYQEMSASVPENQMYSYLLGLGNFRAGFTCCFPRCLSVKTCIMWKKVN